MAYAYQQLCTPADIAMLRQARKRGGDRAVERVRRAIGARIDLTAKRREAERVELMGDDRDHGWPPPFLSGGK